MKSLLLCLLLTILFVSCKTEQLALIPTYNKGGYTFKTYKSKHLAAQDSVYIGGSIVDVVKKEPLDFGKIKLGCFTSEYKHNYKFKLTEWNIAVPLTATYLAYLTVETAPFTTQAGDSIVVDFYLAPYEKPFINCEGVYN